MKRLLHIVLSYARIWACAIFLLVFSGIASAQQTVHGRVTDETGEGAIGVNILVVGTSTGSVTDMDGFFTINGVATGSQLRFSLVGYKTELVTWRGGEVRVQLSEDTEVLGEVVVTAMGIERKASSLTYATQQVKAADIMRVQDPNAINGLQGKVAGLTITPTAGGAGGASKILLRGNQSILGNNSPLIVVDGIPMTNNVRSQLGVDAGSSLTYASVSEGSDPLSEINPDDIESINVLKGANAAALYGSAAANGVVMITTKKGNESRLHVGFTSNTTFEQPLLTPAIQNRYGAAVNLNSSTMAANSWGKALSAQTSEELAFSGVNGNVHLRNVAANDVADFFNTGNTANNSVTLSGGTKNVKSYFSYANSHADGMVPDNTYDRNTFASRYTFSALKERLTMDLSINYVQTKTINRPGGGTVLNPLYDLYTMPRNVDMAYYRANPVAQDAAWTAIGVGHYVDNGSGGYTWESTDVALKGPHMNWWGWETAGHNNPYWLTGVNRNVVDNDRVYGYASGMLKLWYGFDLKARVSLDRTNTDGDYRRNATTENPAAMEYYGVYGQDILSTREIYTDYMLNWNREVKDFTFSATGGWVGHVIRGTTQKLWQTATKYDGRNIMLPTTINYFSPVISDAGSWSYYETSNWDKALLVTGQMGWKEAVWLDGSYRRDWYRAFRQFSHRGLSDNYGYFSFGGNVLTEKLVTLPEVLNHLKVRASYSEVGNSIPNMLYNTVRSSTLTGAVATSNYVIANPIPEKTHSTEIGLDAALWKNLLTLDLTYYNMVLDNAYLETGSTGGKTIVTNSAVIRNRGVEATIGLNLSEPNTGLLWRSSLNLSYNANRILETSTNDQGVSIPLEKKIANNKVSVIYQKGGAYGDMYARDFDRNDDGTICVSPDDGSVSLSNNYVFVGNMNAKWQLGWNNTLTWKGVQMSFLIDGKIGGKVVSFTEAELDRLGLSERSANARREAEKNGWYWQRPVLDDMDNIVGYEATDIPAMQIEDGQWVPVQAWYESIGGDVNATQYIYDATNFRLRELAVGYTWKNLLGKDRDVTLSAIGRNLFFLYLKAPVDPDISLSTQNSLSAFEIFSMPSARSLGISLKLNL